MISVVKCNPPAKFEVFPSTRISQKAKKLSTILVLLGARIDTYKIEGAYVYLGQCGPTSGRMRAAQPSNV